MLQFSFQIVSLMGSSLFSFIPGSFLSFFLHPSLHPSDSLHSFQPFFSPFLSPSFLPFPPSSPLPPLPQVVPHCALLSLGRSDKHPLDARTDSLWGTANDPSVGAQRGGSDGCVRHLDINGRKLQGLSLHLSHSQSLIPRSSVQHALLAVLLY